MTDQRTSPAVLRKRAVCALLGVSLAHLDRLRQRGEFPPAIRLGEQAIGFRRIDIDAWLAARPTVTH